VVTTRQHRHGERRTDSLVISKGGFFNGKVTKMNG